MGQYYKPAALTDDKKAVHAWAYSHDYDNGLKLMEHSYLGNSFMNLIERLLMPNGAWYKKPIIWAGDYADAEPNENGEVPEEGGITIYGMCSNNEQLKLPVGMNTKKIRGYNYIVNHDTKEFVDKRKCPVDSTWTDPKTKKEYKFYIHPLSLLTCDGNGRGGGDFRKDNEYVGKWARNHISIESRKPKGYTEIQPDFLER